jgi:nicotinate-nucleotide adenylyltransferase
MVDLVLQAKLHFDKGELGPSLEILNAVIQYNTSDPDVFLLRGLIHYRMQKWGDAINDFGAVLEIDSDHAEAKMRMEMAKNILGYFTPDMFNP